MSIGRRGVGGRERWIVMLDKTKGLSLCILLVLVNNLADVNPGCKKLQSKVNTILLLYSLGACLEYSSMTDICPSLNLHRYTLELTSIQCWLTLN